jgi:transposase InsO family protein
MDLFGPLLILALGEVSMVLLLLMTILASLGYSFRINLKPIKTLKRFQRWAQNEFELKVKKIRSDNGFEFKILQVMEYLEEEGIKHEFSAPYTPQQNGVVERKNRTLVDMARMMLGEYKMFKVVLVGNREYSMSCHKPPLSSLPPQEDGI